MIMPSEDFGIDADTLEAAQCQFDFGCLTGSRVCETERFVDRDVALLRCLDARDCQHRSRYGNMSICSCPVKHAQLA